MIPFTQPKPSECPKCLAPPHWRPRHWRRGEGGWEDVTDEPLDPEFLAWGCQNCGYQMLTATADAEMNRTTSALDLVEWDPRG